MFGERLKCKRIKLGLTQEQLANKLGVSRFNVANWERGGNKASIKCLIKLANTFNCSIDYLVGRKL